MARLIEVPDAGACPSSLTVGPGDVLLFRAAGGHVRSGADVVEGWGPFLSAVVGDDGSVLAPAGSPNMVLFRACRNGQARIEVIEGDPFHAARTVVLDINVAA
jgi:hypothetical protein